MLLAVERIRLGVPRLEVGCCVALLMLVTATLN
jgi:hypothetical protein